MNTFRIDTANILLFMLYLGVVKQNDTEKCQMLCVTAPRIFSQLNITFLILKFLVILHIYI